MKRPSDLEVAINVKRSFHLREPACLSRVLTLLATQVTNACVWTYESTATGIGGESTTFYSPDEPSRFVVMEYKGAPSCLWPAKAYVGLI